MRRSVLASDSVGAVVMRCAFCVISNPADSEGGLGHDRGVLIDPQILQDARELDLLSTYESILAELARRGVIRTNDSPVGQYAEWLAARVLDGTLEANSVKSHDLVCDEFGRVQVKSRVVRGNSKRAETQLSPFRSFEFDHALILLFDARYAVASATIMAADLIRLAGRQSSHVNGSIVRATPALLLSGVDVTARFLSAG